MNWVSNSTAVGVFIIFAIAAYFARKMQDKGEIEDKVKRIEKKKKGTEEEKKESFWTKITERWEKTTGKKDDKGRHLIMFPIVFLFFYYGIAQYFRFWEPDLYQPWKNESALLYGFIPLAILATAWALTLKRSLISVAAFVLLAFLSWGVAVEYGKTGWWKGTRCTIEHMLDQVAAEKAAKESSDREYEYKKAEAEGETVVIVAHPNVWTQAHEFQSRGWKHWFKPDGEVEFSVNGMPPRRDGPGKVTDYDKGTTGIRTIRFRSLENRDVVVKITLVTR